MERSKRSLNTRMKHGDDDGVNKAQLEPQCVHNYQEDSQRTTTLTDDKKRDYENEGSTMHDDSCIGITYAHMFPECFRSHHCWVSLCTSCRQFNCCRCKPFTQISPVREFLAEIHTAKTDHQRCCLYRLVVLFLVFAKVFHHFVSQRRIFSVVRFSSLIRN